MFLDAVLLLLLFALPLNLLHRSVQGTLYMRPISTLGWSLLLRHVQHHSILLLLLLLLFEEILRLSLTQIDLRMAQLLLREL